jgi:hypothetical protein
MATEIAAQGVADANTPTVPVATNEAPPVLTKPQAVGIGTTPTMNDEKEAAKEVEQPNTPLPIDTPPPTNAPKTEADKKRNKTLMYVLGAVAILAIFYFVSRKK